jgi:hypothetical protein
MPGALQLLGSFLVGFLASSLAPVAAVHVQAWVDQGTVEPLPPPVFCIARGLGDYRSDALVVAMEWDNDRAEAVQVSDPYLVLTRGGKGLGEGPLARQTFVMAGSYSGLDPDRFVYPYDRRTSFALEPGSVSTHVLIFRPFGYDADPDALPPFEPEDPRTFRFKNGPYSVGVGYGYTKGPESENADADRKLFVMRFSPAGRDRHEGPGEGEVSDCWSRQQEDPDRVAAAPADPG